VDYVRLKDGNNDWNHKDNNRGLVVALQAVGVDDLLSDTTSMETMD
jgi:hypothetical protein